MIDDVSVPDPAHSTRLNACICPECGTGFIPRKEHAAFCGTPCRMAWNNRRRDRGAMLYDLYMAFRFRRADARRLNVFAAMNRLAHLFRSEDMADRAGRLSWQASEVVFERYPSIITKMGRA